MLPKPPPKKKGETGGEYEGNTKETPREYEENTKTTGLHLPCKWLADG
jgi:hypothetical protein